MMLNIVGIEANDPWAANGIAKQSKDNTWGISIERWRMDESRWHPLAIIKEILKFTALYQRLYKLILVHRNVLVSL